MASVHQKHPPPRVMVSVISGVGVGVESEFILLAFAGEQEVK
jgi:hypothetical protein